MTNIDIYAILASKPHNPHYLNRYWKFINFCIESNKNLSNSIYTEKHHICPKAKDLFPEHDKEVWNIVVLTANQHIIAHVILWKAYSGSQALALECILGQFNNKTNSHLSNRKIPDKIERRYLAKSREDAAKYRGEYRIGYSVYKDSKNNKYFLKSDDPKIQELNLVGNNSGYSHSEEGKERMSGDRVTTLYKNGRPDVVISLRVRAANYQSEIDRLLSTGWTLEISNEYRAEVESARIEKLKEVMTGSIGYYYPDGTFYGRIKHTDPIIEQLGLVHKRSENQIRQVKEICIKNANDPIVQAKKSKSISALSWFFNPETQERKRLAECPAGWKPGRFGTKTSNGTTAWNDGVRTYKVKPGDIIEPHWVKGMAPRKAHTYIFSNGTDRIVLVGNNTPPDGYFRVIK